MGPVGVMMANGPWSGSLGWLALIPALLFVLAFGLCAYAFSLWRTNRSSDRIQTLSRQEMIPGREDRGGLSGGQNRKASADILKARYTRGDISLAEYEKRLDVLLEDPSGSGHELGRTA